MRNFIWIALSITLMLTASTNAQTTVDLATTTLRGGAGVYVPIKAAGSEDIIIQGFDLMLDPGTWDLEVWKWNTVGQLGVVTGPWQWTKIGTGTGVQGNTTGNLSEMIHIPIALAHTISTGTIQTFYVTVRNSPNGEHGVRFASPDSSFYGDSNIEILSGAVANDYPLSNPVNLGIRMAGRVHYSTLSSGSGSDDVGLAWIGSPFSNTAASCGTTSQSNSNSPVVIGVRNNRAAPVPAGTVLPVSYSISDGVAPPIVGSAAITLAADLNTHEVVQYAFPTTVNLSWSQTWSITATVSWSADVNSSNDSRSKTIRHHSHTRHGPWTENFDNVLPSASSSYGNWVYTPAGWNNLQPVTGATLSSQTTGDGYWFFRRGPTPSSSTGPVLGDHTTGGTTGAYMHIEDSTSAGSFNPIEMYAPCTDLSTFAGTPTLKFWLCSSPTSNPNMLNIDIIDAGTGSPIRTNGVATYGPESDRGWYQKSIDLSSYAGSKIIVVFRSTNAGAGYLSDVSVDDISLLDVVPLTGQPKQSGLAGLDINGASVNGNGQNVASGDNGPFHVNVASGSMMNINIHGVPWHPWILLTGPSNVNAGGGAWGQFDIGVSSGNAIPNGLTILANGADPSFYGFWQATFTTGYGDHTTSWSFNLAPGLVIPLQAVVLTGQSNVFALSNSVVITVTM